MKHFRPFAKVPIGYQPPSGGCVLKPQISSTPWLRKARPAAFGRLCVETRQAAPAAPVDDPAAFGRLCVETLDGDALSKITPQPPSGGCVLKRQP